jgi:hypothetical protein
VAPDDRYVELRRRMINRKQNVEDDPTYSPEFSRDLSYRYNGLLSLERHLIEGIRLIVNGYIATPALTLTSVWRAIGSREPSAPKR